MPWRPEPTRPYQARDQATTSRMMSRVRSRGSNAERALRRALASHGLRYRLHVKAVIGKPDFVFHALRLAIFVDGDFWHGRGILEDGVEQFRRTMRTERREWWIAKLSANITRDQNVNRSLRRCGWRVLRFWESEVLKDPERSARRVATAVKRRRRVRETKNV